MRKDQKTIFIHAHHEYEKGLSNYASFKLRSVELSQDLVQDTFIKTWTYLVNGGEIEKMKAFLYHVLNGLIIDEYRKRKTTSLDMLLGNGYEPVVDESERITDLIDGKIATELITKLPIQYQKIMKMRYVQNLSLSEIALLTGKSKNTTAVYSHRGLEKLKALYFSQLSLQES